MQSILKEIVLSNVIVNNGNLKTYDYSFCIEFYKSLNNICCDNIYKIFSEYDEICSKNGIRSHIVSNKIFEYTQNRTEELYYLAIKFVPDTFNKIKNKSYSLIKFALSHYGYLIAYIKNPSRELYMLSLSTWPEVLDSIEHQDEELIKIALKCSGRRTFNYIKNLNKYSIDTITEFYKIAIDQDPYNVKYINKCPTYPNDKSTEIYKIALTKNYYTLSRIKCQNYELCLFAMNVDIRSFGCINQSCLTKEEYNKLSNIYYSKIYE
jgi:hypothetical protein